MSALMGLVTLTFDLETGNRVGSNVGNFPSKFGHARPLGSRNIRYVRDGWTDGQKQRLLPPSLLAGTYKSTANDTRARNRRRKPIPENPRQFLERLSCILVQYFSNTGFW